MEKNRSIISIIFAFLLMPFIVNGASLSISPSSGTYEVGQNFSVKVIASSNVSLNAISGALSIPSSVFSIESVSKSSSILNFWVTEPSFSNTTGVVSFEGVALNGFTGGAGTVVVVNLKATKVGTGNITFQNGQILANDGQGTSITGPLTGGNFTIKPATVRPTPIKQKPEPVKEKEEVKEELKVKVEPLVLKAPEIVYSNKYGLPAIYGESEHKNFGVLVSFVASNGSKIFITGDIDDRGEFSLLVPNSLKSGEYEVSAFVVKDNFQSASSNKLKIKVGNFFSDISLWLKVLLVFLLLLVLWLLFLLKYRKSKKVRCDLGKEVKEAETALHQSFDILREDVMEQVHVFEKMKGDKSFTLDDKKTLRQLRKDLDESEKNISDEIDDIK